MYQGPKVQLAELGRGGAFLIQTTALIFAYATRASHVDPLQFCRRHSEHFKIPESVTQQPLYTLTYTEMVIFRLSFLGFCRAPSLVSF